MTNYVLAESFNRANVQKRLWYAMEDSDKAKIAENEKVQFGDRVYIIKTKATYIMGNDNTWYAM